MLLLDWILSFYLFPVLTGKKSEQIYREPEPEFLSRYQPEPEPELKYWRLQPKLIYLIMIGMRIGTKIMVGSWNQTVLSSNRSVVCQKDSYLTNKITDTGKLPVLVVLLVKFFAFFDYFSKVLVKVLLKCRKWR